jgi:hypothetical protein
VENPSQDEIALAQRGEKDYTVDLSRLDELVKSYVENIKEKFPECTRYTKQQVNFWKDLVWYSTIGHAGEWLSLHFACVEPAEGMRAFAEKRKPDYKGIRQKLAEGKSPELLWGAYTKECKACNTKYIPDSFSYCGKCGTKLYP